MQASAFRRVIGVQVRGDGPAIVKTDGHDGPGNRETNPKSRPKLDRVIIIQAQIILPTGTSVEKQDAPQGAHDRVLKLGVPNEQSPSSQRGPDSPFPVTTDCVGAS